MRQDMFTLSGTPITTSNFGNFISVHFIIWEVLVAIVRRFFTSLGTYIFIMHAYIYSYLIAGSFTSAVCVELSLRLFIAQ